MLFENPTDYGVAHSKTAIALYAVPSQQNPLHSVALLIKEKNVASLRNATQYNVY